MKKYLKLSLVLILAFCIGTTINVSAKTTCSTKGKVTTCITKKKGYKSFAKKVVTTKNSSNKIIKQNSIAKRKNGKYYRIQNKNYYSNGKLCYYRNINHTSKGKRTKVTITKYTNKSVRTSYVIYNYKNGKLKTGAKQTQYKFYSNNKVSAKRIGKYNKNGKIKWEAWNTKSYLKNKPITQTTYIIDDAYRNALRAETIRLTNNLRAQNGLNKLVSHPKLQIMVDIRAKELETLFSHTRPNGKEAHTIKDEVYPVNEDNLDTYWTYSENAGGYGMDGWMDKPTLTDMSPQQAGKQLYELWYNSSGHKAAMLRKSNKYIAIGLSVENPSEPLCGGSAIMGFGIPW